MSSAQDRDGPRRRVTTRREPEAPENAVLHPQRMQLPHDRRTSSVGPSDRGEQNLRRLRRVGRSDIHPTGLSGANSRMNERPAGGSRSLVTPGSSRTFPARPARPRRRESRRQELRGHDHEARAAPCPNRTNERAGRLVEPTREKDAVGRRAGHVSGELTSRGALGSRRLKATTFIRASGRPSGSRSPSAVRRAGLRRGSRRRSSARAGARARRSRRPERCRWG